MYAFMWYVIVTCAPLLVTVLVPLLLLLLFSSYLSAADGPSLPTKADTEFKPFIRRLPEFKFW